MALVGACGPRNCSRACLRRSGRSRLPTWSARNGGFIKKWGQSNFSVSLEACLDADGDAVRHDAQYERRMALVRQVAGDSTESESRKHVGLPVRLHFHSRNRVVGGQQFERPDGGMILPVLKDIRRDDRADLGDFAARKAAVAALEPLG